MTKDKISQESRTATCRIPTTCSGGEKKTKQTNTILRHTECSCSQNTACCCGSSHPQAFSGKIIILWWRFYKLVSSGCWSCNMQKRQANRILNILIYSKWHTNESSEWARVLGLFPSRACFCRTRCVRTDEKHANARYLHTHRRFYETLRHALWEARSPLHWACLLQSKKIDGSLAVCNAEPDFQSFALFKTTAPKTFCDMTRPHTPVGAHVCARVHRNAIMPGTLGQLSFIQI